MLEDLDASALLMASQEADTSNHASMMETKHEEAAPSTTTTTRDENSLYLLDSSTTLLLDDNHSSHDSEKAPKPRNHHSDESSALLQDLHLPTTMDANLDQEDEPSTLTTSNTSSQIMQVAQRIQEKANTLQQEQTQLYTLQSQMEQLKHDLKSLKQQNSIVRQKLLQQLITRHSTESCLLAQHQELYSISQQNSKCQDEIHALKQEIQNQSVLLLKEQELYIPHLAKTDIYKRKCNDELMSLQVKRQKRDTALEMLVQEHERNLENVQLLKAEAEQWNQDITRMKCAEMQEDEEIACLSMQIKATMAKRTSLRNALKDARGRYDTAQGNMMTWEEECMKYTNSSSKRRGCDR